MRLRKLAAAALVAVAVLVLVAPAAGAADPGTEEGEHLVECVEDALHDNEKAIEDKDYTTFRTDLDDCRKAKSLLVPVWSEVLWSTVAFVVVLFGLVKFGFPAVKKALKAREDRIRDDLESASKAKSDAETELTQYRAQLADAQSEANRIVEEARVDAERVRRDLVARAESEAADVRARAQDDARLAQERAMSDLRSRVVDLSIELAERVVERNLDHDTQVALIESYINSVGNGSR